MNAVISPEAREAKRRYNREYMRKWRAMHPDKVAANNRSYWERRARKETDDAKVTTAE